MKGAIRVHKKIQKLYPRGNRWVRRLDTAVMFVAIILPFTTIPQIYKIFATRTADGVSLVTWSLYFILSIPFLTWGLIHKEKPIIVMYSLWLLVHAIVIMGTLMYG